MELQTRKQSGPRRRKSGRCGLFAKTRAMRLMDTRCEATESEPPDVCRFMRPYVEREEVEVFWVLALNTRSRVIHGSPLVITRGILDSTTVRPREVFRAAILVMAAGIIAVHNHPSGDPTPSAEDRAVTRQLVAAGQLVDMPLYDHVILAGERYASFATAGLL